MGSEMCIRDSIDTKMFGEQLPKSTLAAYTKLHTQVPVNSDALARLLALAKEFVVRVSNTAN